MPFHQVSGILLAVIRWPVAFAALALLPAAAMAFYAEILVSWKVLQGLFAGAAAYGVFWWWQVRHWSVDWFSTLEHELTHCLFAWLTGNRVTGLRVTLRQGGHMQFLGTGNWLIALAPYFFPTLTVLCLVLMLVFPFFSGTYAQGIVGVTLAYHLTSTWTETHHAQTDLREAGFLFCWMFLPTANVASLGVMLAAVRSGQFGVLQWFKALAVSPWFPKAIFSWMAS